MFSPPYTFFSVGFIMSWHLSSSSCVVPPLLVDVLLLLFGNICFFICMICLEMHYRGSQGAASVCIAHGWLLTAEISSLKAGSSPHNATWSRPYLWCVDWAVLYMSVFVPRYASLKCNFRSSSPAKTPFFLQPVVMWLTLNVHAALYYIIQYLVLVSNTGGSSSRSVGSFVFCGVRGAAVLFWEHGLRLSLPSVWRPGQRQWASFCNTKEETHLQVFVRRNDGWWKCARQISEDDRM